MQDAQRILVTGGAGFIGSHIVDQAQSAGHEVAALDDLSSGTRDNLPSGVRLFVADIRDAVAVRQALEEFRPTAVCHQAAQMSVSRSVREPGFDAQVNVLGLLNVLEEAARAAVTRVVFASSGGVLYGDVDEPATEDHPAAPISPYGISKWVGEKYLEFFSHNSQLQTVALRYSNVFGPRQNPHGEAGVVAIFCNRMLAGEVCTIHGDGSCVRDYVYVGDVARANLLAATATDLPPFVAFNIGTGVGVTVTDLERMLREKFEELTESDAEKPRHGPSRAGDLKSSLVSANRARAMLGWTPMTLLPEGIDRTVRWFAERSRSVNK